MVTFVGILVFIIICMVLVNVIGLRIRNKGMRQIIPSELKSAEQCLAITNDGRHVAYCRYGSQDQTKPVVINIHGSGLEANFERATYAPICESLNCRGIAISLPGCGFSDEKPGRFVKDWPAEDLAAVLEAESVHQFHITGHSQGTPHAMAAALHFPQRCIGLGLNAPLIPTSLCKELGFANTLGTGKTPTSQQLKKVYMGWYFSFMAIVFGVLPPSLLSQFIKKGFPNVIADDELVRRFESSMRRAVVRGTSGATWETAQDTCFDWGFDVRDVKHSNVVVWHSDDDSAIPAEQGKWLAEYFAADYRHNSEGYGHMTYCQGQYLQPQNSLVAALIAGHNLI
jgi:pimeloyl-ACP methyl ester carboxylesterase